ncbi:MAG: isocitrate/isopropylmalate family dehydrogenase [Myxococcota bacterium]
MAAEARLALLAGDGIGPEVMAAARLVLEASGAAFDLELSFDEIPCGGRYYLEHGRDWPEDAEARCAAADLLLLGAVGWPSPTGSGPVTMANGHMAGHSAVLGNRARLDLFANVRPIRLFEGVRPIVAGRPSEVWRPAEVDLVIVRENTEGLYVGAGGTLRPGGQPTVATDTRIVTWAGSQRVCRVAFDLARRRGTPKVTAVVKHNVLEGCRLFVDAFEALGSDFPEVEREVMLVDAFALAVLQDPARFEVVVTTNLFGDILTDLAAILQGGMGMAVGANLGHQHAMFEPVHGSAPDLAGRGVANPLAMILATAEALRWWGARRGSPFEVAAAAIDAAVSEVLRRGESLPADLTGGEGASTMTVARAVADEIQRHSAG